ncbi:MAG: histidine phosphatase family protein [Microbacterium sp.]
MPTPRIHLVRHGEVENPTGVVYGRLEGFRLSARGERQAQAAADLLGELEVPVGSIVSSPLERTLQSAAPIASRYGLEIARDDDLVEASSRLEGKDYDVSLTILARPEAWRYLVNPLRPSWGESYTGVLARMTRAVDRAVSDAPEGDIVIVSHQLPIWVLKRRAAGRSLAHDPRRRRCALSSITSFEMRNGSLVEVDYHDPGALL